MLTFSVTKAEVPRFVSLLDGPSSSRGNRYPRARLSYRRRDKSHSRPRSWQDHRLGVAFIKRRHPQRLARFPPAPLEGGGMHYLRFTAGSTASMSMPAASTRCILKKCAVTPEPMPPMCSAVPRLPHRLLRTAPVSRRWVHMRRRSSADRPLHLARLRSPQDRSRPSLDAGGLELPRFRGQFTAWAGQVSS